MSNSVSLQNGATQIWSLSQKWLTLNKLPNFAQLVYATLFTSWYLESLCNASNPIWQKSLILVKLDLCRGAGPVTILFWFRTLFALEDIGEVELDTSQSNWILKKPMTILSRILSRKRLSSSNCRPTSLPSS